MSDKRREPYYALNINDGEDVLHRDPREECNLDDSEGRQTIDAATAASLLMKEQAQTCLHCWPDE